MTIEVQGPDGSSFEFPDGTSSDVITGAMQRHYGAAPAFDRNDPRFQDESSAAALRGVPIAGAFVNKAGAALSALAHPVTGVGSGKATFGERYAENLAQEDAAQKAFEEEHPVLDTVAKGIGGTLALGGAGGASTAAARALGMTGRLVPAMRNAALSGASIGAIDAAARGGDPQAAALEGALTGPAAVLGGKLLGRGVGAVRDLVSSRPATSTQFLDVNGTKVPVSASTLSRDPVQAGQEQIYAAGGGGDAAQQIAAKANQATREAIQQAQDSFSAGLDPTGSNVRVTPEEAATAVSADLVSQEAQRAAAEAQRGTRAAADLMGLRTDLVPANPAPETPYGAGQQVSEAIRTGATQARNARTAAYQAQEGIPGEFNPAHMLRAGNEIRTALNNPQAPGGRVMISPQVTPIAQQALEVIDRDVTGLEFPNDVARGTRPITPADVEQTRKALVQLRATANRAARQNGNWEDARAVGRVMDEFDNFVQRTAQSPGGFSGDANAYLAGQARARALHAAYRQTYSSQGPGDTVGRFIENVIGKYPGQELTPDAIAKQLFGSATEPGGGNTVQIVQRLRNMFGENSPEWGAIRKAILNHLTEDIGGPLPHGEQADRILRFLQGTKGRLLAETIFNPSERANLARYANQVRSVADPAPASAAEKVVARFGGRDNAVPSSTTDIVNHLFDLRGNKEISVQTVRLLKNQLPPETFAQIKQGMWSKLSEAPAGAQPFGSQKISTNIGQFLKSQLAKEIYTPQERALMKIIGDAHAKLVPVPGSTNPSNSANTFAKIARGASNQLLALFGFSHGGLTGAGMALAAGRAVKSIGERRAAKAAEQLFYGPQPRRAVPNFQRALAIAASAPMSIRDQASR